jgi:hypothetical protein
MSASTSRWLGRVLYLGLTILVLIVSLMNLDGQAGEGTGAFLAYSMLIVSFPIGFIIYAVLAVVLYLIHDFSGAYLPFGVVYVLLFWSVMFVTGYLQWFALLPILKRWRSKRKANVDM